MLYGRGESNYRLFYLLFIQIGFIGGEVKIDKQKENSNQAVVCHFRRRFQVLFQNEEVSDEEVASRRGAEMCAKPLPF